MFMKYMGTGKSVSLCAMNTSYEKVITMRELKHLAIILDGNGRWAKKRGLPRTAGHIQGAKNVEEIARVCYKKGIQFLTVYAFSTENWKRPEEEVRTLMKLLDNYIDNCIKTAKKDNLRVRFIGDRNGLDPKLLKKMEGLEEFSKEHTGLLLQIALNYGARDELTRAIRQIVAEKENGNIKVEDITENLIENYLDTAGIPDPDLMIRTSGELRLSNYMLWQLAYSEFYFTEVAWPDFDEKELDKAIEVYNNRERRFGGV